MDVITVETKAFKELMAKINVIANYVFSRQDDCKEEELRGMYFPENK